MKILFLHGWHSVPGGVKPTYLASHGHTVINPALDDDDFDEAVRTAQAEYDRHRPDVIVGSSRGGAVAMNLDSGSTPLVLLCPAWKRWGTARMVRPGTVVLHSEADDVIPFAESRELERASGLAGSALVVVGNDHRLADPEPLQAMLLACEDRSPIFCGIDISSETSKCAIAIGDVMSNEADGPTLRVRPWKSTDQWEDDWSLPTVAGLLKELSARCQEERRKAIVAVNIPFGYPKAFASYLALHPLQTKPHTDQFTLVDDLVFRACEKQLKRTLFAPESWTTADSRLSLWQHYQSLTTAFFSESDPKRDAKRNKGGSVKASSSFTTSPLCTVADKIGRAIARWIRVACALGARPVGPSVWELEENVYLFECYPVASLVAAGLWHPDLKKKERGPTTRAAVVDLIQRRVIRLAGANDEPSDRDCGAFWGNVLVDDVRASDHTFDAFVCTCTAWWCGGSLLSRYGVAGVNSYPKPPLAGVSDQCFTDPAGNPLDEAEGGIYYPMTPESLLGC